MLRIDKSKARDPPAFYLMLRGSRFFICKVAPSKEGRECALWETPSLWWL
jgi:hypothetical protein